MPGLQARSRDVFGWPWLVVLPSIRREPVQLGALMIEPTDIVALLNAADAAAALTGGRGGTVPVNAAQLRELVTVWLRVAAKHEQIAIQPQLFSPEVRELVECLLLERPPRPAYEVGRGPSAADKANEQEPVPPPFIRCHCGADFLPSAPHCPNCGSFVQ